MADFNIQIQGIQELQHGNMATIEAIQPGSGLGAAVRAAGQEVHRYTIVVTHVDTSALRASHRMDVELSGAEARSVIHIDDSTRNPRSGQPPAIYGPYEHARGGSHAFYERTLQERGDAAVEIGISELMRAMP